MSALEKHTVYEELVLCKQSNDIELIHKQPEKGERPRPGCRCREPIENRQKNKHDMYVMSSFFLFQAAVWKNILHLPDRQLTQSPGFNPVTIEILERITKIERKALYPILKRMKDQTLISAQTSNGNKGSWAISSAGVCRTVCDYCALHTKTLSLDGFNK